MNKVDEILGKASAGELDMDAALGNLDLEGAEAKVDQMRSGGGEAIEVAAGDNDCGDGCKI